MSELPAALGRVRPAVEHRLEEVLAGCRRRWEDLGRAVPEMLDTSGSVLNGGKRMRAVLGAIGCTLLSAPEHRAECLVGTDAVHLGAALELYQASALVHDDLMDGAETRRGLPAAHRAFARQHDAHGWLGRSQTFGVNGAILLGDILLSLAGEEMSALAGAHTSPETDHGAARHARAAFDAMTTEVALGQFLDVRGENLPLPWGQDPAAAAQRMHDNALSVVRHKSARYSVRHPLLIGALLAGLDPTSPTAGHLAVFGEEIGIAFQLRDDDLGVFGLPQVTGKPAGDDLREGKRTVLLALAWGRCDEADRELLGSVLANAEATQAQITEAAALIEDCGARSAHEEIVAFHRDAGRSALDRLRAEGVVSAASLDDLAALTDLLTHRNS